LDNASYHDLALRPQIVTRAPGFTLIEILVVIFIVALITSVIVLKNMNTFTLSSKTTAYHLLNVFQLAEQEAMLQGEVLGFSITPAGYQFLVFQNSEDGLSGKWSLLTDNRFLAASSLPSRIKLETTQHIIIFPTGELTPFTLNIGINHQIQYQLIGETNGNLRVEKQ
jgi:type II secretion system protein H